MISVKCFTAEEQKEFILIHSGDTPKAWAIMDNEFVWNFYDTEEEASKDAKALILERKYRRAVGGRFACWAGNTAEELGLQRASIYQIIKTYLE